MEGYVKISNGNNSAEVHTGNGHRLSDSQITINGEKLNTRAKVYDGKTYVDISFVNKIAEISGSQYAPISQDSISPARSYDKFPT